MMVEKFVLVFCMLGLFCTLVFSENNILWDFGVEIKQSDLQNNPKGSHRQHPDKQEVFHAKINAIITDPFVPPIKRTFQTKIDEPLIFKLPKNITKLTLEKNIYQIVSIAKKYYFKKNYQHVIELLYQKKLNMLSEHKRHYLEYLLANAFYHTGQYKKAQEHVLLLLDQNESDRLYMLLAMIYESMGENNTAKEYYLKLITQFPDSDYIISAKIKSRILGQH